MKDVEGIAELIEAQSTIIRMQSEAIDDLFNALSQHISSEELERAFKLGKIAEIVDIKERTRAKFGDVCG
jgi:hypothetical protein